MVLDGGHCDLELTSPSPRLYRQLLLIKKNLKRIGTFKDILFYLVLTVHYYTEFFFYLTDGLLTLTISFLIVFVFFYDQ